MLLGLNHNKGKTEASAKEAPINNINGLVDIGSKLPNFGPFAYINIKIPIM